jgi:regulator of sigma E protease
MGPLLFKYKPKKSETTYSLRLFPIGGYVSMAEKEDKKSKISKERVLENKGFFKVLWVLINGIVFNFILAIVLFFISGLIYGKPVSEAIVNKVVAGEAAELAGLSPGDKIIKVNGNKINTFDDFILEATAKTVKDNKYIVTVITSSGETKEYELVPRIEKRDNEEIRVYGIEFVGTIHKKGFKNALSYAFTGTIENSTTIFKILGSLFTGKVSVKNLSGPVGIYSIIDRVKSEGFEMLFYLTAYLSINVGIINLFPIPVFDGGRILILFIEKIIGHKTDEKLETILNYVGFALIILLMVYVTINDVSRLVG